MRRIITFSWGAFFLFVSSCYVHQSPPTDTETHFLKSCTEDCGDGLICLCGVCTRVCENNDICEAQASGAVCVSPDGLEDIPQCATCPVSFPVCDIPCMKDVDCVSLGNAFYCQNGFCRDETSQDVIDPDHGIERQESVPEGYPCEPVEIFADDPGTPTRECLSFSSRCDVPQGWFYSHSLAGCKNPVCGDFTMIPTQWTWTTWGYGEDVYHVSTLLWVYGGATCLDFPGSNDTNKLVLLWDEGEALAVFGSPPGTGTMGWWVRSCYGDFCEVGDIFETNEVYPGFPYNERLRDLVQSYGLPDNLCGHVFNRDLIEHIHCAPLRPLN